MVLGKDMKHNKNGKESDVAQKCFIWFEKHAKLKHKMLRDKLIKSIIAKCRLYTAFHLLLFFLPGHCSIRWARSSASDSCWFSTVTQLRYQHCPRECWEWTKQQHINSSTPRACKQKQKAPGRWVRYLQQSGNSTQQLRGHAASPDKGQKFQCFRLPPEQRTYCQDNK